ncbi:pentatricopeptide repeat-containing protein At1g19720 isoform X2 [Coffea arabica]|uniref:Pentatricopeptide repeat-containing protein At1g19720 isoform X2 n=1 Tax=Coffea arabica TaxID=13443 RepID=A0ABM4VY59_COFAR
MEGTILPCKTVTPKFPEISQNPVKSRLPFKNIPRNAHLTIMDAHLTYLCRNGRLTEAIASLDSIAQCGSMIVGMYAKCGSLEDAYKMFDEMSERNLYAWSAMIGACTRERKWDEVVVLFYLMMMEDGIVPDEFLFPKILQACGNSGDVETGRLIHGIVIKCGMNFQLRVNNAILAVYAKCGFSDLAKRFFGSMVLKDTVSWNSIITGYCQKGELEKARRFFELMREEGFEPSLVTWNILISSYSQLGKYDVVMEMMVEMQSCGILPDVFTWTCLISGFAQFNRKTEALECFEKMLLAGVQPNEVTLISLLSMYASLKDLKKGRELHAWALKAGFGENLLVGNSLVDMYSKCAKVEAARQVFDMMSARDMYTWNSMIGGYCQAGYCGKAHDLFRKMRESDVEPTVITWNTLISGYMQNGDDDQAMDLFQRMEKDGHIKQDTASWNALIAGYLLTGNKDKALGIFRQMQSLCVKPNSFTILSILPACSNLIAAKKVKELHCCVLRRNLDCELSVANSLIDTFAKSGNIKYSRTIFNSLLAKDIITWNTLIAGYVIHGRAVDAIELFNDMSHTELKPNRGTFVSMISAYGLARMVGEGNRIFSRMIEEHHISPCLDHCAAMVNLFGRSGMLEDAVDFINNMTIEPNSSIWAALLTASRVHGNIELAVYAGERLLELEPENALIYQLVLQLYALSGIPEDSFKAKEPRKMKDAKECLGWSWIEDENTVQSFVGGSQCQQINWVMHSWIKRMAPKSKRSDLSNGLPVEEEESEALSGVHSEKLAFAFALSKSSSASICMRVVKNMRMCKGCHETAKFISNTYRREIYLCDSKCLHHFRDGHCSCNDYW